MFHVFSSRKSRGGWLLLLFLLALGVRANAASPPTPWWDDFPLISSTGDINLSKGQNATVSFNGMGDPSWGLYGDRINYDPSNNPMIQAHANGMQSIGYFETFGTACEYIVELTTKAPNDDYMQAGHSLWSWNWPGYPRPANCTVAWVGPQNWFDCESFTGIYNRKHPRYGGRAMMYADGVTTATGYSSRYSNLGSLDPRNSNVLDASISKNILGEGPPADASEPSGVNPADPTTYAGLVPVNGKYIGGFSYCKDSACPYWIDQEYASALYAADKGLDGMWTDNFSPWDSFSSTPVTEAFGDWSVAGFRTYLSTHFSAAQLQAMGVTDASTFDVRAAMRQKLKALGGDDTNLYDAKWSASSWLSDPLWLAYVIYKRQTGTKALKDYYDATKAAARLAGKPDFFVCGNDIPFFGLGWPRGDLDMVSTEMSPGWSLGAGSRGITLPPYGRFAPVWKLAREHAKSRFVNVWMYIEGDYAPYQGKSGIANVLNFEMLATHATPMLFPEEARKLGNFDCNGAFFKFVKDSKATFGGRVPVEDIGIYYSTSSLLATMTPGGVLSFDNQPHEFAVLGWGTALGELHYQYRDIPEWKLNADTLAKLRVLIIPNSEVFDPADVPTVNAWVNAGGRLIVTGNSGQRLGEAGNFATTTTLTLSPLTGITRISSRTVTRKVLSVGSGKVIFEKNNLGLNYFGTVNTTSTVEFRASYLPTLKADMDELLNDQAPLALSAGDQTTATVGLTLYRDDQARRLFIDVNNLNIQPDDTMVRSPQISFSIQKPEWLQGNAKVSVIAPTNLPGETPEALPTAQYLETEPGSATITLSPIKYYASIMIEPEVKATPTPTPVVTPTPTPVVTPTPTPVVTPTPTPVVTPTPTPVVTPTPTPVALVVSNLSRSGCVIDWLLPGKLVYGDRDYTFVGPVPADLFEQIYIRMLNNEKSVTTSSFLSFDANIPVEVTVGISSLITTPPSWMRGNGWAKRTDQIQTTDSGAPGRVLYKKRFGAGRITLGPNYETGMVAGRSMYSVVIKPAANWAKEWNLYE